MKKLLYLIIAIALLSGCASAKKDIQVKKGMSKRQVEFLWGNPREVINSKNSCCMQKSEEEWYYFNAYRQRKAPDKSVIFEDGRVEYVFVWE